MAADVRVSRLSPREARLVKIMTHLGYGRIENLLVREGEPLFDPPPRVIREQKFGDRGSDRPDLEGSDFALKSEVVDLLRTLRSMGNGAVDCLEVRHGLPFRMSKEEPLTP